MGLLVGHFLMTMGSCLAGELFRLEGWTGVAGEVSELIAKVLSFCLKGAEHVFGVLSEFCIHVPDSHIKEQIKNSFVVRRKEEAIEHSDAKLDALGARGPGTSDYMLRTLRSLVKFTWLLIGNNISGTFQM